MVAEAVTFFTGSVAKFEQRGMTATGVVPRPGRPGPLGEVESPFCCARGHFLNSVAFFAPEK